MKYLSHVRQKSLGSEINGKLRNKFDNPIVFSTYWLDPAHGYEGELHES